MRLPLILGLLLATGCYANTDDLEAQSLSTCDSLTGPCSAGLEALPLSGCVLSGYIGPVTIGGQTFNLIMDTGSTSIGIASTTCTNCGSISPLLQDSSAGGGTQPVVSSYGDGSGWTGSPDLTTIALLSDIQPLRLEVAAVTAQTFASSGVGFFRPSQCSGQSQANAYQGIFGLAGAAIALPGTQSYLDVLQTTTQSDAFAFAPCTNGGSLWLGGYAPAAVSASPQFTPMNTQQGYYEINLGDLQLGGQSLGLQPTDLGSTVVDTGTSILLVPNSVFSAVTQGVLGTATFGSLFPATFFTDGACVVPATSMTRAQLDSSLPSVGVVLPGTGGGTFTLDLPATEAYLTPAMTPNGTVCYLPAIAAIQASGGPQIIFGSSAMQKHVVIFDRAGQQLGFAPSTVCD